MDLSDAVILNSSRLKSVVWNDFDRVRKGDTTVAICRHCKKKLSGSSTSGTSHLRNHLIRCRRRSNHDIAQLIAAREKKKDGIRTLGSFDNGQKQDAALNLVRYEQDQAKDGTINIGNYNLDQMRSRFDLARMIILHGYPLAMVDDIGFKIFVKNLQPLFELVTFSRIEADCIEIYEKEKQKVYEVVDKLPGKISLSAHLYTGLGDAEYLSLTAHYIDEDWQLKKKVLNFIMIDPSHTEDMLSEAIMTCLMDWDIDRKLFSMTIDNCSTNDNIVSRIKDRLSQNRFLLCNGQLFDVHCAANVINLMVLDALEALCEITHKIRESIRFVKSSRVTQEKLNEMAQEVRVDGQRGLWIDNPLQWNSTYYMLEVALEYRGAFTLLQEHDIAYTLCPSDLEWERASAITSFLKSFVEVTNDFAANKYLTSNIYFAEICEIHLQMIEWCKSSDKDISSLASKMKSKFDKYWDNCILTLAVAAILDPRFKMKLVEYYYPQIYGNSAPDRINDVSENLRVLYNEHAICSPLASDQGLAWQVGSGGGSGAGCIGNAENGRDRLTGFDKFLHETSQSQNIKSDLDKYLEEPLFPRNADFSILNWWKVHMPKYPVVSMMARNVLGIPMSKVGLESAFNIGGRVLDPDWSRLSPATLQALMCAQDWMKDERLEADFKQHSSHMPLAITYDAN